jgi:hypothetical protein
MKNKIEEFLAAAQEVWQILSKFLFLRCVLRNFFSAVDRRFDVVEERISVIEEILKSKL